MLLIIKIMLNSGSPQEGTQKRCAPQSHFHSELLSLLSLSASKMPNSHSMLSKLFAVPGRTGSISSQGVWTGRLTSAAQQTIQHLRSRPRVSPPTAGRRRSMMHPAISCHIQRIRLASRPLSSRGFSRARSANRFFLEPARRPLQDDTATS
jgi:hypothetical protein